MKIKTIKKEIVVLSSEDINAMNTVANIFNTCIRNEIEVEDEDGLTLTAVDFETVIDIMDRFYTGISFENLSE